MSRTKKILLASLGLVLLLAAIAYRLLMPGALFLVRFMDQSNGAELSGVPFTLKETVIPQPGRKIKVRIYKPKNGFKRAVLVVHGVHFGGYDEPRLVHFSKRLAGLGYAVVTPEIDDLKTYDIRIRAVRDIEQSAKWLLNDSGLMDREGRDKLGLFGISFAGGLCLSAVSSHELKNRVAFVFSFGGHADLDRTMAFLTTGDPEGGKLPPNIYGQAVLVRRFATQLVPAEEAVLLRKVLLDYLEERFSKVKSDLDKLAPRSKQLVELCLKRETQALGAILKPLVHGYHSPPLLSPTRGSPPPCPVFLLHGSLDNVIPPSETIALSQWASRSTRTVTLVSSLIKHVELENKEDESVSPYAYFEIIRFFTELLRI